MDSSFKYNFLSIRSYGEKMVDKVVPLYRIGSEIESMLPTPDKATRELKRIEDAMKKAVRRAERK